MPEIKIFPGYLTTDIYHPLLFMIAWEYVTIIFKGYSLTNFMKQDLFIKKQFEMVKIVYSIVQ